MPILTIPKKRQGAAPNISTFEANATATQSISHGLCFQNMFADLDQIATFPFGLGRSGSELKGF